MGLMDLARGGGGGVDSNNNNTVNHHLGNKRRGGGGGIRGMKNNSALVQRYLAAVDGEAIELVLPTSPKSRRLQKQQHQSPPPQPQQPTSPSGRSRSSHTTKSTKYTVRTAGSDSAVWNEALTPSSSAAVPLKSRRNSSHKGHPSQPPVSHKHPEDTTNSTKRRTLSPRALSPAAVRNVAHSPSAATSPLRRGLFPRSLLRSNNNNHNHNSSGSNPPTNNATATTSTTKPSKSSSSSLIRKWNTDHFSKGKPSANVSMTTSTRPLPSSSNIPSPRQRSFGKRNNVSQYHTRSDDDDDSSLTSRRTTESKESPYRDSRRRRSLQREEDDEEDNDDEEETSSYYDEDDDEEEEESTRSGHYRTSHHPQPQKLQDSKTIHNNKVGRPMNQFSMEKTFDEAVEKGLDMLLNTNAWTCTVPQSHLQQPPPMRPTPPSTPSIPRSARDTQQMLTTMTTTSVPVTNTTPPAHQRRKQRHEEALLRHTLSADTPLSDVTGAATEIATNRAIDLALKRIRNIEYNNDNNHNTTTITASDVPPQTTTSSTTIPKLDPPASQLSITTKSSDNSTVTNRVKQVAKSFERTTGNDTSIVTPLSVARLGSNGLNRRTFENIGTTNSISRKGRLGQHFQESKNCYTQPPPIGERSVETMKSLSTSVGVEIDDRVSRIPVSSTLKAYSDVNRTQQPDTAADVSNDWMRVPLPYGPENSNLPKYPAAIRPLYGQTRAVVDTIPSTPVSSRYKLPTPHIGRYKAIDPCMSPPQIVRKSHSYDPVSPDPIFCSKSMSMSINSSTMVFSPQQSSNASVEASFQSEDAMFMEKLDESVSTAVSNSHKSVRVVPIESHSRTLDSSSSSNCPPSKVTPEESGHTETTCDIYTDEEGTNSNDNERYSPYMEILGIRGRFPTAPIYANQAVTPPQQHFHSPQVSVSRLVPLVPFDSPSPPALIDDALSLSRDYHIGSSFNHDQSISQLDERSPPHGVKYGGKTIFHTAVAKPEPVRSRPNRFVGVGMNSNPSTKYSGNSALATKLSRTVASLNEDEVDIRSVDVKSIRSAFESIMGSRDTNMENDDNDDDVASVRSLRERFEPPILTIPTENGISKARAIFERNVSKSKSTPDVAANSHAARILDRRVHRIDVNHHPQEYAPSLSDNLDEEVSKDGENVDVVSANLSFERKPFTVAERVRAFSGQSRNAKVNQINKYGTRDIVLSSSSTLPKSSATPPAELSFTSKRSPRNRISTLRALGGKAFKCGPSKDTSDSFDFDGIANTSGDSITLYKSMRENANDLPNSKSLSNDEADIQFDSPSPAINPSIMTEIQKISAAHDADDQIIQERLPKIKSSGFYSNAGSKPLWMEQREKILSRSRNSSRVATAACESKRETALILSVIEKESPGCNAEKEVVFVGDIRHRSLKGKGTDEDDLYPVTNAPIGDTTHELVNVKSATVWSQETVDNYHIHPQPAYQLRRSVSENPKPAYKLHRTASENVRPVEKENSDHLLPFCLQSPLSNEEYVSTNRIETSDEPTIVLNGLYDEKKEEDEYEVLQLTESSMATVETETEIDVVPEAVHCKQNNEAQEARPLVIRPVARKPYVRPVPIKPVIKSIPVIPFGRSMSDPTSTNILTKLAATATQVNDADSRFVPRALVDEKYATLELPRLVEGILEPVAREDIVDSASESSEFSDGVTLDLSIADVSNLTNPTALISKLGGHNYEEDQTRSEMSSDERPLDHRNSTRNKRDNGGDAKQSEASSSQTSEAAAPLLARAMRSFPLSDEISTDSFFRSRANAAKKQWNTISHSNRSMPSYALFEENSNDDDSRFGSDVDGIWDIRQVESLFPSTGRSKTIAQTHGCDTHGAWQPFPLHSESNGSPKAVTDHVSDHDETGFLQNDNVATSTTPSRSKTPTRRNTTRSLLVPPLNATVLLPTLHDEIPQSQPNIMYNVAPASVMDEWDQQSYNGVGGTDNCRLESEASYPVLSTTSSNVSGKTSRTIVSNLLSSSTSGATSFNDAYSMKFSTTSTIPVSNKSTASTSTVSAYGPKHSALLARIQALKESRLRRATRMAPYTRRPSTALAYQGSDQQPYY